jgi:DNA-binding response OmpR family regulator
LSRILRLFPGALGGVLHTNGPLEPGADPSLSFRTRGNNQRSLVDVQFARGSNGLDAAMVIKAQHGVPAIAVTANPDEERARKAGLLGLVPKPYASAVLAAVLRAAAEWLEKGRVQENSSRFLFLGG